MKLKLLFLALIFSPCILHAQEQVLMEVNGQPVTKSEFEYIYNKNNSDNSLDKKTLEEYVEMFANFKLKVEEAKAQGIDTAQTFLSELKSYRKTLTEPYLNDREAEDAVAREAYGRMLEDIDISHILIAVPAGAGVADTLAAFEKINTAYNRLTGGQTAKNGKKAKPEDFEKVAREVSDDQSAAANGGHIGWTSAFRFIYSFEMAAYSTPVGGLSKPFRTPFGYHVVKVHARRKSPGEVHTAHIMIRTAAGNDSLNTAAKARIDSIYTRIKQGDNFGQLAARLSDDQGTAANNGELPWFGTGRMVAPFENAAFALKDSGDVSLPVQSNYGWHIIKLLEKREIADFETLKPDIMRYMQQDERANTGKKSFIEKTKKAENFTLNNENLSEFARLLEGRHLGDSAYIAEISKLNKPLFAIGEKTFTQADFAKYLQSYPAAHQVIPAEIIAGKFTEFSDEKTLEYADSKLESRYPDFKFLINEYHEGILLFEINNREVWEKAAKDTEGLAKFFKKNASKYKWEKPHYKGRIVYCKDEATFKAAKNIVKYSVPDSIDKNLRSRLNDSIQYVKIERGLFVQGENPAVDTYGLKVKKPEYKPSADYPFVFAAGKALKKPENYTDVRGQVTTDYQDFLETEWVKALRAKYSVKINRDVLQTIKEN